MKTNHSRIAEISRDKRKGSDTSVHEVNSVCGNTLIPRLSYLSDTFLKDLK